MSGVIRVDELRVEDVVGEDSIDLRDPLVLAILRGISQEDTKDADRAREAILAVVRQAEASSFLPVRDGELRRVGIQAEHGWGAFPIHLGGYLLHREIGRGGFSQVFEGTRPGDSRSFAIKVFHHRWLDALERLEIERLILQRLDHPNLVSAIDSGQASDGTTYLVMPMIHGDRIDRHIERRKLGYAEIAKLFAQVAQGLHYAHERGVIHRDIKPGNILVTEEGCAIVADFGLAKQLRVNQAGSFALPSITETGTIVGTLGYLAPEQAGLGLGDITRAVDIYGVGATLYRVLTGTLPGDGLGIGSGSRMKFRGVSGRVPAGLRLICMKCLERVPSDRYGTMAELGEDLTRFALGERVLVRRKPWRQRMRQWVQSELLSFSLASALVLAMVIGLMIALWNLAKTEQQRLQAEGERMSKDGMRLVAESLKRTADEDREAMLSLLFDTHSMLSKGDRQAERELRSVPGTSDYRRKRLEQSIGFFQSLISKFPENVELLENFAVSSYLLAQVNHLLGHQDKCLIGVDDALAKFRRLVTLVPDKAEYRFDVFHCFLLRYYAQEAAESDETRSTLRAAASVIEGLLSDYPNNRDYLDAGLFVRIKLHEYEAENSERNWMLTYQSACDLKALESSPSLRWKHAGTAARGVTNWHWTRSDRWKSEEWLDIAKIETLDFLKRPDVVPEDRQELMACLGLEAAIAFMSNDLGRSLRCRREWYREVRELCRIYPDRPQFTSLEPIAPFFFYYLVGFGLSETVGAGEYSPDYLDPSCVSEEYE